MLRDCWQIAIMPIEDEREQRFSEGTGDIVFPAAIRRIAESGIVPVVFLSNAFQWTCPDCGHIAVGTIGEHEVSGWDNPVWVRSGLEHAPTLRPSLGCPHCFPQGKGHFWLTEGVLTRC